MKAFNLITHKSQISQNRVYCDTGRARESESPWCALGVVFNPLQHPSINKNTKRCTKVMNERSYASDNSCVPTLYTTLCPTNVPHTSSFPSVLTHTPAGTGKPAFRCVRLCVWAYGCCFKSHSLHKRKPRGRQPLSMQSAHLITAVFPQPCASHVPSDS
jgi:hypothetical protein